MLQKEDFQLNVVDIIANDNKELKDYRDSFEKYHEAIKELQRIKDSIAQSRENEEFMRFQFEEINKAQLEDGEQETIEQETEQLSHSEEIKEAL